jgi:hypothetical protein
MNKKSRELLTHTFCGPRFEDHGLDVDVLPELIACKTILVETAKELWHRAHPDRTRLPRKFEESLSLKFFEIGEGSTAVPLMREIEFDPAEFAFEPPPDEFDEAADLLAEAIDSAARDVPLPTAFPKNVMPLFANYGKTLGAGESFALKPVRRPAAATYLPEVRDRLIQWSQNVYEDTIDLTGEVRAADLDGCNFHLRLDDGTKVPGKFNPDQEAMITDALRDHASSRLRIQGQGEFTPTDGKLRRIRSVRQITSHVPGSVVYDQMARPIWEVAVEIGAAVPPEEWAKVPTDLSKNLDHYLYGEPGHIQ